MTEQAFNDFLEAISEDDIDTVKTLYNKYKFDYDEPVPKDDEGITALHHCGDTKMFDLLIELGYPVDLTDFIGRTVLHVYSWCCFDGTEFVNKFVNKLIKLGLNINQQDLDGYTPLHYAAMSCDVELVKVLLSKGADKTLTDDVERNTPLESIQYDDYLLVNRGLMIVNKTRLQMIPKEDDKLETTLLLSVGIPLYEFFYDLKDDCSDIDLHQAMIEEEKFDKKKLYNELTKPYVLFISYVNEIYKADPDCDYFSIEAFDNKDDFNNKCKSIGGLYKQVYMFENGKNTTSEYNF